MMLLSVNWFIDQHVKVLETVAGNYLCSDMVMTHTTCALDILLTVRICRVVVENTFCAPVEAAHYHKVSLVLWPPTETLLTHGQEAAVFYG